MTEKLTWLPHPSNLTGSLVCSTGNGEWCVHKSCSDDTWRLHYGRLRDYSGIKLPISMEAGMFSSRSQAVLVADMVERRQGGDETSLLRTHGFEPYGSPLDSDVTAADLWHQTLEKSHFIVKLGDSWVSLTCDHGTKHQTVASLAWKGNCCPEGSEGRREIVLSSILEVFRVRQLRPKNEAHLPMSDEELYTWRDVGKPGVKSNRRIKP